MWVPFPCSPSCLLCSSPCQPAGQKIVSFCTGNCALQTPTCSHTCGIDALFQLQAAATAANLQQIFPSVTRVVPQRGKVPLCFPATRLTAPAAALGPVPKGGQESTLFRLEWCFVKLSQMGLRGACSARLACPLAPRQGKICLNLS